MQGDSKPHTGATVVYNRLLVGFFFIVGGAEPYNKWPQADGLHWQGASGVPLHRTGR